MKVELHSFPNLGYLTTDIPENLLNQLKEIIYEKELEKANYGLAGNIEKEFFIPKAIPIFEKYILDMCNLYNEHFRYLDDMNVCTNNVPLVLQRMWVNFQKKHEFNPLHDHNGIFSFVVWIKVPFTREEENSKSSGKKGNHNVPGCFELTYINALGNIKAETLFVDKKMEGKLCFFPAKMCHLVYPFNTSDEYRISVSGNVALKT